MADIVKRSGPDHALYHDAGDQNLAPWYEGITVGIDLAESGSDRTAFTTFAGGKVVVLVDPPMKDITGVATVRRK